MKPSLALFILVLLGFNVIPRNVNGIADAIGDPGLTLLVLMIGLMVLFFVGVGAIISYVSRGGSPLVLAGLVVVSLFSFLLAGCEERPAPVLRVNDNSLVTFDYGPDNSKYLYRVDSIVFREIGDITFEDSPRCMVIITHQQRRRADQPAYFARLTSGCSMGESHFFADTLVVDGLAFH